MIPLYIIFSLSMIALSIGGRVIAKGVIEDLREGDYSFATAGLITVALILVFILILGSELIQLSNKI